jgi:hypothetical protein
MKTLTVLNSSGTRFRVAIIRKGDSYGYQDCLTHDKDDPLIEFHTLGSDDATTEKILSVHGSKGAFVSRYNLDTFTGGVWHTPGNGLCLDGGRSDMWVDGYIVQMAVHLAGEWC